MSYFNKVFLIGNLTRNPELTHTPSQTAVCSFSLAVNRSWMGQDGAKKEETCFVNCTAFGGTADTINKYMTKGMPIFVEGRLNFNSWTAEDGSKKSQLKVIVEKFEFLPNGKRKEEPSTEDDPLVPPF